MKDITYQTQRELRERQLGRILYVGAIAETMITDADAAVELYDRIAETLRSYDPEEDTKGVTLDDLMDGRAIELAQAATGFAKVSGSTLQFIDGLCEDIGVLTNKKVRVARDRVLAARRIVCRRDLRRGVDIVNDAIRSLIDMPGGMHKELGDALINVHKESFARACDHARAAGVSRREIDEIVRSVEAMEDCWRERWQ